jgi:transposase
MSDVTFASPDLTTFCRLDDLGLVVTGQHVTERRAVLECRVVADGGVCCGCGAAGRARDSRTRRLAHVPFGGRPTTLCVRLRRYRCAACRRVWHQDLSAAAEPRARLSRGGLRWALEAIVCQHLSVARVAEALGVSWDTANSAVLAEGKRVLFDDPTRFDGVHVIGVDEHVWRHTRLGDKYVTVILDLTALRAGTGHARLLDMVPGQSKQAFATWLAARPQSWRDGVQVVAMDGFTGFKTAAAEQVPDAVAVLDPFHVVRWGGDALDETRRRVQQDTLGHRGRRGDPLYSARRTLLTGIDLLTDKQAQRLEDLFADDAHVQVQAAWGIYQKMITAYRDPDRARGRTTMATLIDGLAHGVPPALSEVAKLGHTLAYRAADILAYFTRPHTSNGPTEAINGRLEHLRGTALGFRNLTHYTARSLLEAGGFIPRLRPSY